MNEDLQTDSLEIAWGLDSIPDNSRVVLFMDDMKSSRLCVGTRKDKLQVVKTYAGDLCSTDGQTMSAILQEIYRKYPARSYAMVMCSHASGWLFDDPGESSQAPCRRSFGIDNGNRTNSNSGRRMNIPVLANVLQGFPKLDFLMFDACFMQCVEAAYELRFVADYILASPAEIPGTGAPYTTLMREMCSVPTNVGALAQKYKYYYEYGAGYSTYGGVELSVVNTSYLKTLMETTAPLLWSLMANRTTPVLNGVQPYYPGYSSQRYTAFFDLKNLLYVNLDKESYERWVQVFNMAVPVQALSSRWFSSYGTYGTTMAMQDAAHCGGVSMYVPREEHTWNGWLQDYHQLQWYQDAGLYVTKW
ncbi:MAG: hypothetical protein K6C30_05220 [Bacteroidaceae bacterium]|nr:hypothetical protein [Bacteroidaceae bacterium]